MVSMGQRAMVFPFPLVPKPVTKTDQMAQWGPKPGSSNTQAASARLRAAGSGMNCAFLGRTRRSKDVSGTKANRQSNDSGTAKIGEGHREDVRIIFMLRGSKRKGQMFQ